MPGSPAPNITYTSPPGNYDRLAYLGGGTWSYEEKESRLTYRYGNIRSGDLARLLSIADADGNTVLLAYDTEAKLISLTDAAGRVTTFGYDANKHCTAVVLPDQAFRLLRLRRPGESHPHGGPGRQ